MSYPKKVKTHVPVELDGLTAAEVAEDLAGALESLQSQSPEATAENTRIEIVAESVDYDEAFANCYLLFERDETPAEVAEREAKETAEKWVEYDRLGNELRGTK